MISVTSGHPLLTWIQQRMPLSITSLVSEQAAISLHWFFCPVFAAFNGTFESSLNISHWNSLLLPSKILYCVSNTTLPNNERSLAPKRHTSKTECSFCIVPMSYFYILPFQRYLPRQQRKRLSFPWTEKLLKAKLTLERGMKRRQAFWGSRCFSVEEDFRNRKR